MTTYISLFSGAGGFEHPRLKPIVACEMDPACVRVLRRRLRGAALHDDVLTLMPPHVDFVVGGWPCQDISSAGTRAGLDGLRSGLFFRMVQIASAAGAHTIVGENVPNLLSVNKGMEFERVILTLVNAGYRYIAWRTLNARQFGLPQERKRVFVVASKHKEFALALHSAEPSTEGGAAPDYPRASGFYWTGGGRSVCFSNGYTPALKVGASDSKGRSVIAIFQEGRLSKLSADGCARLQGFSPMDFVGESKTDVVRMAGNAVAVPMGKFVIQTVFKGRNHQIEFCGSGMQLGFGRFHCDGFYEERAVWRVRHQAGRLATNLDSFVSDDSGDPLSGQAAAGLIVRAVRSGKPLPPDLFEALLLLSEERSSYRASRSNSFEALDKLDVDNYRNVIRSTRQVAREPATEVRQLNLLAM